MPKKTPLEQFIADTGGDRRATYEKNMRAKGNKKLTVWVPEVVADEVRALCASLIHSEDPGSFFEALHNLAAQAAGKTKQ